MSACLLDEQFAGPTLDSRLQWLHPPARWSLNSEKRHLVVEPLPSTDFWQRTHYGFRADNGHFLGLEAAGDFAVSTQVRFNPVHQYDQAGLMIRVDADCWVKASVEHELDGAPQLGVVVTNGGFSDWSLQDLPFTEPHIRLSLTLRGGDLAAEFGAPGTAGWKMMRVAHLQLPADAPCWCGLYACSPKGAGFRAEFTWLRVQRVGKKN
jgi:regulation of enolase protein 1 (concanavalin A-like superfamily)